MNLLAIWPLLVCLVAYRNRVSNARVTVNVRAASDRISQQPLRSPLASHHRQGQNEARYQPPKPAERDLTTETKCLACASRASTAFYTINNLPVQSNVLLRTRQEARDYPRGDLELTVCQRCGFISNRLFDTRRQGPLADYEASQAFSPRFVRYMDELCQWLIEAYGVSQQTVLEIGCGSGDFIKRLCELGKNAGWGIDPTCLPTQSSGPPSPGEAVLVRESYEAATPGRGADVLACRHTLEHIPDVLEFMKMVRQACDKEGARLVCFEVPDTLRILKETAFWDVYYEHCSYFGSGSLERLFQRSGFAVKELVKVYDDQYLVIVAEPAPTAVEERCLDLDETLASTGKFASNLDQLRAKWRAELEVVSTAGGAAVLWGAGSKAAGFLSTVGSDAIEYIVDINPRKQGMFQAGSAQEIIAPERLTQINPHTVILMNPIYRDEVQRDLDKMGVKTRLLPL